MRKAFVEAFLQSLRVVLGADGIALKLGQEGREVAIGHSDGAKLLPCSTTRVAVAKV